MAGTSGYYQKWYHEVIVWAEENSALGNNSREWAFGNGSVGNIGIPMWRDCQVVTLLYQAETHSGGNATISLEKNNIATGAQLIANSSVVVQNLTVPVLFESKDVLGFRTVSNGGGGKNDVRVGAVIRMSLV